MELCSSADASCHRTLSTPSFSLAWWRSLVELYEVASQRDLIKFFVGKFVHMVVEALESILRSGMMGIFLRQQATPHPHPRVPLQWKISGTSPRAQSGSWVPKKL